MPTSFSLHPDERVMLFIDGPAAYNNAKLLGFEIDYDALRRYISGQCRLLRCHYYTVSRYRDDPTHGSDYNVVKPLLDFLEYHGFTVTEKEIVEGAGTNGVSRTRGSIHTEMIVDMLVVGAKADHIILFCGDGDLTYAVQALQHRGQKVTVVSTITTVPASCADELRRQADVFVELGDIKSTVTRERKPK